MAKGTHREARRREVVKLMLELAELERAAQATIERLRIAYEEKAKATAKAAERYERIADDVLALEFDDFAELAYVERLEVDAAEWTRAARELESQDG